MIMQREEDKRKPSTPLLSEATDRRAFLRLAGVGVASLMAGGAGVLSSSRAEAFRASGGQLPGRAAGDTFAPHVEIALTARPAEFPLLPGARTPVWSYAGRVLRGNPAVLGPSPGGWLGPTLRLHRGDRVRIHFENALPEPSIIHWHGLHVPAAADGHPRDAVGPGATYVYEFEVENRAGTYWYHPHPHGRTGPQVYHGLAGLLIVSDDEEKALGLPSGERDIPLVLQDRSFDAANRLVYLPGGMMNRMTGSLGDQVVVNGQPGFALSAATRVYRLRLLNGSNARIYKLAWDDGTPMTVIASDGGLLEQPVTRRFATLAPAERVEILLDLRERPVGATLALRSLPFSGTGGGMGGMMARMGGGVTNGAPLPVLTVRVDRKEKDNFTLPTRLSTIPRYRLKDAMNGANPRRISLSMARMSWQLNGRPFEMERVASNEIVRLNTLEAWEFVNPVGGMGMMGGMAMAHPMHIHGGQFQVLGREVLPAFAAGRNTLREGFVDEGWKDTVLVMPGERVRLLMRFEKHVGLFIYHCHNLEHEDMGMMRNYVVRA